MHYHAYTTRFASMKLYTAESQRTNIAFPISSVAPAVVRDWLLKPRRFITATFDTPDAAADWHAKWIANTTRPSGSWLLLTPAAKVEFTRSELEHGNDRVDSFHVDGGEYVEAAIVCCPADGYRCPADR